MKTHIISILFLSLFSLTAISQSTYTWDGDTSTDPTDGDNWVGGVAPTLVDGNKLGDYIIINTATYYPVYSSGLTVGINLTSPPFTKRSGSVTIKPGAKVTINVFLWIEQSYGDFKIESDDTGDGQLIFDDEYSYTHNKDITVEMYITGGDAGSSQYRFHYFVPPVQSMAIDNSSIANTGSDLGMTSFNGDLTYYYEPNATTSKEAAWRYFDGYGEDGYSGFSSLTPAQGYNIYSTGTSDKITFSGQLNAAEHSYTLSYTSANGSYAGWNLVGNPYPCNYDLEGIDELMTSDNVYNTVYFNHNGGYTYWNPSTGSGSSGLSDIIPPMQGFFVLVDATGQSLTLPVASKTTSSAQSRQKSGTTSSIPKLKFQLLKDGLADETIVCFIEDATNDFDGDYDGYKLFGNSSSDFIYTELNSVKYAINAVPEPDASGADIPLVLDLKESGSYTISISEYDNLSNYDIVLKHGEVETNLSQGASYTFTSDAGVFTDFQISATKGTTGLEDLTKERFNAWYQDQYLYMYCPEEMQTQRGRVLIIDLQGKKVFDKEMELPGGQTTQLPVQLSTGIYVTRILSSGKPYTKKIVVY